ncbi:hypothetical protein Cni_G22115 [Canna indica]|uniref:Uncharacterized protein n=1 Tax=Canna indica TaxID=4628 RepID=A0AAQ3KRB6_9LILI|nr:hypothetical protein Cni_G22115 [Canna indica]
MGRKLKAALPATAIFLLFAASFWLHIFHDLLPFVVARFSLKYSTVLSHHVDRFRPNYSIRESIRSLPKLPLSAIADSVLLPNWEALSQQDPSREMMWYTWLVYELVSTSDDVIFFAKGINHRHGTNNPVSVLRCIFSPTSGGATIVVTSISSSAQEVFGCPHPPSANVLAAGSLYVSLVFETDALPIPTVAEYLSPHATSIGGAADAARSLRAFIWANTMAYDISKFLPKWVAYHVGIGVDHFFSYDNGSEDKLEAAVSR